MIISMTGKPCSGKSATIEKLSKDYGFDVFYSGALFREEAKKRGLTVLELNQLNDFNVDYLLDKKIIEEGIKRQNDEVIFDSRLAWALLSVLNMKTFLDIKSDVQAKRLIGSGRQGDENSDVSFEQAKKDLQARWEAENNRYEILYGTSNNNDKSVYDFVLDTSDLSIEETAKMVHEKYCTYVDTGKQKRKQESIANICESALKDTTQTQNRIAEIIENALKQEKSKSKTAEFGQN